VIARGGAISAKMEAQVGPRRNEGWLQPLERPALLWMAAHMPPRVTPDQLTVLGLVGSAIVFTGYVLSSHDPGFLWLANFGLLVNWVGDSMDGTLARYRKIERPKYGFFLDHTTDLLTEVMFALGLGLSSFVRFEIACLALIVYLLMAAFIFLRAQVSGLMQITISRIGPTEVRVGMVILNIAMFVVPPKPVLTLWAPVSLVDLAVLAAAAVGFVLFLVAIRREARRLAAMDPTPPSRDAGIGKTSR
jgi:archaetidylinositol phosphate synthase